MSYIAKGIVFNNDGTVQEKPVEKTVKVKASHLKMANSTEKEIQQEVDKFFDEKPEVNIDHPPKEPKQKELIPKPEPDTEQENYSPRYEVVAVLKIKGANGQPYTVPLISGEFPRDRIEECLLQKVKAKRLNDVINAITGHDPEVEEKKKKEKADAKKEAKQKEKEDKKGAAKDKKKAGAGKVGAGSTKDKKETGTKKEKKPTEAGNTGTKKKGGDK